MKAFIKELAEAEELSDQKLNPSATMLANVKSRAKALGPPEFTEDDEDNTMTFEYFLAVNKVIITSAYKQIES